MVTVKADNRRRVQIPGIRPGQIFIFEDQGNGIRVLTEIKKDVKEPFPEGSLGKYWTKEHNAALTKIAKATIIGVPKDYPE